MESRKIRRRPREFRSHYFVLREPFFSKQLYLLLSLLFVINIQLNSNQCCLAKKKSTIPRSVHPRQRYISDPLYDGDDSDLGDYENNPYLYYPDPPWKPSPKIDKDGFLTQRYMRISGEWETEANIGGKHGSRSKAFRNLSNIPVTIRQVPGDGNCLFHSLSACLSLVESGKHISMRRNTIENASDKDAKSSSKQNEHDFTSRHKHKRKRSKRTKGIYEKSRLLRQRAVDALSSNPRRMLFLQGSEYLRARDLVDAAAAQYDMTGEEYCELMRKDSYWGGGPEIVALCNVLRRPIHVYELTSSTGNSDSPRLESDEAGHGQSGGAIDDRNTGRKRKKSRSLALIGNKKAEFRLRRMACFGSPKFDGKEPLHILSADSRFPDLRPGKQNAAGNHFLAIFPGYNPK
eukprot:CAMPEP_0184872182 /NCGR_PEP_ID=MMETSP0580-20130426/41137_1 /TAXON_ID=1118495 /ORGANISM="Dactyliosolen fragilissimus" /LENGTH=403 /DNA_ID=CAMNT_0027374933 /DNA_START=43 /DNA_END=1254 /DNA_ORIENTATION=+